MRNKMISLSAVLAMVVMTLMLGCEKVQLPDNDTDEGEGNGNLRINVSQIEQTPFASLTRTTEAASAVCTRLNFAIYDEGGSRLKQINQTSDKANFGQCAFDIEPGDYQLVIVGHSAGGNPTMTNLSKIQFTNATGYTDTFIYYGKVSVGEAPVELEVSLKRIVSLCRFVINDDIPTEVKKLRFYYTGGSGAFNAVTGQGSVNSKQTVTFDVTSGQKQFDLYTFLHGNDDNIALKVTALDASGNEVRVRDFDVPMQQNHITWLSGDFFNGSGSSSTPILRVTVNTTWAGETHLTF